MKVDEQLKCKDCDWYGSCEYYHNRKETSQICKMFNNTWKFVDKLKKIKAEIEELKPNNPNFTHYIGETRTINNVLEIIDKHISELKGESNE